MKDYLREFCTNLNIELIYTERELIALAVGINSNAPFIKANKMFERCPEKVAKAVIDYYTSSQYENNSLELIKSYIGDNVVSVEYIIKPPDARFKNFFGEHIETNKPLQSVIEEQSTSKDNPAKKTETKSNETKKTTAKSSVTKKSQSKVDITKKSTAKDKMPEYDLSSLIEMEIASIIKSSFYGKSSEIKPDEGIKPSSDDIISLDIEIGDPKL